MMLPDIINGAFEARGAVALTFNVARILRDRQVRGVHWLPTLFFFAWGLWNLFYYRHLGQNFSWFAGMAVAAVNAVYLALMVWAMGIERRQLRQLSEWHKARLKWARSRAGSFL